MSVSNWNKIFLIIAGLMLPQFSQAQVDLRSLLNDLVGYDQDKAKSSANVLFHLMNSEPTELAPENRDRRTNPMSSGLSMKQIMAAITQSDGNPSGNEELSKIYYLEVLSALLRYAPAPMERTDGRLDLRRTVIANIVTAALLDHYKPIPGRVGFLGASTYLESRFVDSMFDNLILYFLEREGEMRVAKLRTPSVVNEFERMYEFFLANQKLFYRAIHIRVPRASDYVGAMRASATGLLMAIYDRNSFDRESAERVLKVLFKETPNMDAQARYEQLQASYYKYGPSIMSERSLLELFTFASHRDHGSDYAKMLQYDNRWAEPKLAQVHGQTINKIMTTVTDNLINTVSASLSEPHLGTIAEYERTLAKLEKSFPHLGLRQNLTARIRSILHSQSGHKDSTAVKMEPTMQVHKRRFAALGLLSALGELNLSDAEAEEVRLRFDASCAAMSMAQAS